MIKKLILSAGLVALACNVADADIVVEQDSADFTYLYEMDVNPGTQDLDGNLTVDFFAGAAGGQIIPQTYAGGFAFSNQGAATPENLFRTDYTNSLTRNTLANDNTPWTIELRVGKTGGAQGTDGWFGTAMQNPGASQSVRVNFEDDRISYRDSGANNDFLVGTDFTSGLHTLRIAYEGGDSYFVWVNDQLLNSDLTTAAGFAGGNGSFNAGGAWFFGDFSGGLAGDWQVDYIRYQDGIASAPVAVPEPTLLGGLPLATLVLLRRRRK